MGNWFANIHIRKKDTVTTEAVIAYIQSILQQKGYEAVDSEAESDAAIYVDSFGDSGWITLWSELLRHDDGDSFRVLAEPISRQLSTDVLGIACFDSDYLYLNLINTENQEDAWVGIGDGKAVGLERKTGITHWKKKVKDYPVFSAAAKQKYICAEEFLQEAVPCLALTVEQGMVSVRNGDLAKDPQALHFRRKEDWSEPDLPQLTLSGYDVRVPCLVDRKSAFRIFSVGVAAFGLSLWFTGPGVEDGSVYFTDVSLGRNGCHVPIELEKIQLSDGRWAYAYHDPYFAIPEAPPKRLTEAKRWAILTEHLINLEFVPRGDQRKMLDISIVLEPGQNEKARIRWNVWEPYGSKKAFIQEHNKIWKRLRAYEEDPAQLLPLLKEADFD